MPLVPTRWLYALAVAAPLGVAIEAVAQAPAVPPPQVAATVNGEVIRLDEVDAVIKRLPPAATPLTSAQTRELRQLVANDLVEDRLLQQFLRQHGPPVEPGELDRHMRALAEAQRKLGKSVADFFREVGRTEAEVRDGWAAMIRFQKLVDRQATEAELRKYHAANREVFDRVTVRVSHIVLRVGPAAPPGERAAAVQKLKQLRAAIVAGTVDFAAAARQQSVCPSAAKGGDLGVITARDSTADEAVARAAFALKVGEVSEPVESEFGVHLVKATDRTAGTPTRFEDCVDQVRDCYTDDVRQALVAKLRKQGSVQVTVP